MSDLDDLFKIVSEGKKKSPKAQMVAEVKQNARKDLDDIFEQLSSIKEDLVTIHDNIIVEEKQEEIIVEDMLAEVSPIPAQPVIRTPEQRIKDTNADVSKYLTGKTFQQPNPDPVDRNLEAVQSKLKFLEQAIGKIAATGPGSGAAEIYNLDMPTRTVNGDYTIGRKDYYIGVNCDVKSYITLPVSGSNIKNGRIVVIKDESGHAQLTPIKIIGMIDNDPNGAEIRINNGAVQLLYSNGQWRIV